MLVHKRSVLYAALTESHCTQFILHMKNKFVPRLVCLALPTPFGACPPALSTHVVSFCCSHLHTHTTHPHTSCSLLLSKQNMEMGEKDRTQKIKKISQQHLQQQQPFQQRHSQPFQQRHSQPFQPRHSQHSQHSQHFHFFQTQNVIIVIVVFVVSIRVPDNGPIFIVNSNGNFVSNDRH